MALYKDRHIDAWNRESRINSHASGELILGKGTRQFCGEMIILPVSHARTTGYLNAKKNLDPDANISSQHPRPSVRPPIVKFIGETPIVYRKLLKCIGEAKTQDKIFGFHLYKIQENELESTVTESTSVFA